MLTPLIAKQLWHKSEIEVEYLRRCAAAGRVGFWFKNNSAHRSRVSEYGYAVGVWLGSSVEPQRWREPPNMLFISSECHRKMDGRLSPREYTIRMIEADGDVRNVSSLGAFSNSKTAHRHMQKIVDWLMHAEVQP